jgi:hypothetical protein
MQGTQQRQRVLKSLRQAANGLTTAEIRAAADLVSDNAARILLLRMVEAGQVERVSPCALGSIAFRGHSHKSSVCGT